MLEEYFCGVSLLPAGLGEVGIGPEERAVAVQFAPVRVPGCGAVVGFGYVVVAFAVAAYVE